MVRYHRERCLGIVVSGVVSLALSCWFLNLYSRNGMAKSDAHRQSLRWKNDEPVRCL
jgi:hypothetical protein